MRSTYLNALATGLLLGVPVALAAVDWIVPNQYIVQFPDGDVTGHNTGFYNSLHEIGVPFTSKKNYSTPLFPATVIESANLSLEQLKELPDVADAWPNTYLPPVEDTKDAVVELPESATQRSSKKRSSEKRETTSYRHWSNRKSVDSLFDKRQASGLEDYWRAIHGLTGVQRLHDDGKKGAGAKIAVIDSGYWLEHPALGGCIGPTCKVIDAWDFVTNDDSPWTTPDNHGTSVAAVAAGKDSIITGVAPDAKLLLYKVIPDVDEWFYKSELTISIDAILRAVEQGADVISHSIGYLVPWSIGPLQNLLDNVAASGIIVTNAASNAGTENVGTLPDRGSAQKSLTASMYVSDIMYGYEVTATSDGTSREIVYSRGIVAPSSASLTVQVIFQPDGVTVADICSDTLPSSFTPNKVVLVRTSGCPADTVSLHSQAMLSAGAGAVLIYGTHGDGGFQNQAGGKVVGFLDNQDDVEWIVTKVLANKPVTVAIPTRANYKVKAVRTGVALGDNIYPSSGSGPTYDLFMGLGVAAPGFNYLSANTHYGGYSSVAGTSFSTPYLAGIAALYISAKGGRASIGPAGMAALREKIITSGRPLEAFPFRGESFPEGALDPVWRQGAGLVNASNVYYTPVEITPAKLDLNDTVHFISNRQITIKNTGSTSLTFTLSHEPALGSYILHPGVPVVPNFFGGPVYDPLIKASVTFPTNTVTIAGHGSASLGLQFAYPSGLTSSRWPLYGGFIRVLSSAGDKFTIPYFGSAGSQKDLTLLYTPPEFTYQPSGSPITTPITLSLSSPTDLPTITVRLAIGSAQVRVDYITTSWAPTNWSYPPTPGTNNFVSAAKDGVKYFTQRNGGGLDQATFQNLVIDGTKADGTKVAPGNYKVRVAVLKGFGNPTVEADWESWVSPVVTVVA